ncbi:MAG: hypothetical protein ACRCT8_08825 [Lacipirellulaceae bacterium]
MLLLANGLEGMFARSVRGDVVTYAVAWPIFGLMGLVVIGVFVQAWRLHKVEDARWIGASVIGAGLAVVFGILAADRVVITPSSFEHRSLGFTGPRVQRFDFAELSAVFIETESKKTSRRGFENVCYSYSLGFRDKNGADQFVTMGDSKCGAILEAARTAEAAGLTVSGITTRLREHGGQIDPRSEAALAAQAARDEQERMIDQMHRQLAEVAVVERLQSDFALSDEQFQQLLKAEWRSHRSEEAVPPWMFAIAHDFRTAAGAG